MGERRSLVDGLKPASDADRLKEKAFVFGSDQSGPRQADPEVKPDEQARPPAANTGLTVAGRVPLTTRIRPDLAGALKRISLERQLAGTTPNSVQDIVEQALEAWLANNGKPQ